MQRHATQQIELLRGSRSIPSCASDGPPAVSRDVGWAGAAEWFCALVTGVVLWTLLEYVLHRIALHRMATIFSPMHGEHHSSPLALIGTPTWLSVLVLHRRRFPSRAAVLSGSASRAPSTIGVMLGYWWYGIVHHVIHHHAHGASMRTSAIFAPGTCGTITRRRAAIWSDHGALGSRVQDRDQLAPESDPFHVSTANPMRADKPIDTDNPTTVPSCRYIPASASSVPPRERGHRAAGWRSGPGGSAGRCRAGAGDCRAAGHRRNGPATGWSAGRPGQARRPGPASPPLHSPRRLSPRLARRR